MNKKYRIKIEETCPDCQGHGQLLNQAEDADMPLLECSGCDGQGYQEIYVTPAVLKLLLKEGV